MNSINNELQEAEKYILDIEDDMVKITLRNVAIAEAMFKNDSSYIRADDINSKPKMNKSGKIVYSGSAAYWITQIKDILIDKKVLSRDNFNYDRCIREIIYAIDRENSTHLNADRVGREEIFNRIVKISKVEFIELLKNPEKNDYKLVKIISEKTSEKRENYSFATKFCHFLCFYLFHGKEEQDNFSIYDGVLAYAIPKYCKKYEISIDELQLKKYTKYIEIIDEIRYKALEEHGYFVSRNGLDHLLWFYYKGRI